MKNSVRHIIASAFLLSSLVAGVCSLEAQQSGNAAAEPNQKFQPQIVTKTVNVINPPARGSITIALKGTELAPGVSGQAKLKMGEADVAIEAQTSGLAAPGSFGSQFETYMVWAITPAGKTFKLGAMKAKGNRFELDTKSAVRSFAMVITAEPYQQVTRPADTIVLEVPVGARPSPRIASSSKVATRRLDINSRRLIQVLATLRKFCKCTTPAASLCLQAPKGTRASKRGDEWFKSVVMSAQHEKKFTDMILQQATSATEYFEAARGKALQPLMQSIVSTK
jgi:hypothetical protein